jgi:Rho GTPase-activating protein 1
VESDYSVVFFAAASRHTPAWNWVWKAYRSLNRKYRKNLKELVCGHLFDLLLHSACDSTLSIRPSFPKVRHVCLLLRKTIIYLS